LRAAAGGDTGLVECGVVQSVTTSAWAWMPMRSAVEAHHERSLRLSLCKDCRSNVDSTVVFFLIEAFYPNTVGIAGLERSFDGDITGQYSFDRQ